MSAPRLTGKALIAAYRKGHGDQSLIAFSGGKDSIATAVTLL